MASIGAVDSTQRLVRTSRRSGACTDAELMARVAGGDREAFADLYGRHGATAYRLAHRLTRDVQLAETVVQEVFLSVWNRADRFDAARAKPLTWLLTITHHRAVDVVRHEERRRTEPARHAADSADDSVDLHRDAWREAQRERVLGALGALSAAQREVIELAYFEGHSQTQLSALLKQPLGTIKSRTHSALAVLRSALEDVGMTSEVALSAS